MDKILMAIGEVKKDTEVIKENVEKINSRVGKVERKARNLEEGFRRKELDCPFKDVIKTLVDNALTQEALKEYVNEQNRKSNQKSRKVVAVTSLIFTVIVVAINILERVL